MWSCGAYHCVKLLRGHNKSAIKIAPSHRHSGLALRTMGGSMLLSRCIAFILLGACALLSAGVASAQTYPTHPVRIVTSEVGGGSDFVARIVAQGLSANLGQQVIVDNRVGAITPEVLLRAAADGYTIMVSGATFWLAPLFRKTSYDPVKDFAPVSMLSDSPNILVVHPSVAVTSVKELIALAKAKPK